jgi:hypothetical protein
MGEREELNKYRQVHGGKRVVTSERILKDLNFQQKAPQAEHRRKVVEHMKRKGQSTRTKEARRDLDHNGWASWLRTGEEDCSRRVEGNWDVERKNEEKMKKRKHCSLRFLNNAL